MDRNASRNKRWAVRKNSQPFLVLVTVVAVFSTALLLSPFSAAAPNRGEGTWSDSFDSPKANIGIEELTGTKVASGGLRLAEALPESPGDTGDLGVPVPGESGVYSVLCTDLGASAANLYTGTGEKGHLVEYDPTQLYQEKYEGPTHLGVSNSRGQAVPPDDISTPSRVTSLATDGALIYGGTYPDGHLFSFEPDDGSGDPIHRAVVDLGAAPGGGSILSLAWDGAVLYGGTSEGHLFSYDGSFTDLGTPPSGGAVNALTYDGSTLYGGTENGYIFTYDGSFTELGTPSGGGAIKALTNDGVDVYGGTAAGYVFSYDGSFTDLGQPSGSGDPVNAVAVTGTTLYSGSENGHVYYGTPGSHQDLGEPEGCEGSPVNALAVDIEGRLYGGTGSDAEESEGHLFCMGGYEEHGVHAGHEIAHVNYTASKLFFIDEADELYTYPEPGTFTSLGSPGGATVNDMESVSGGVYFGKNNGELWVYNTGAASDPFSNFGAPDTGSNPVTAVLPLESIGGATVYIGHENGRLFSGAVSSSGQTCEFSGLLGEIPSGEAILDLAWIGGTTGTLYLAGDEGHLYSYSGTSIDDLGLVSGGSAINEIAVGDGIIYLALESGEMFSYDPDDPPAFVFLGSTTGGSPLNCIAAGNQGVIAGADNGNLYMYNQYVSSGSLWDLGASQDATAVLTLCETDNHVWGGTQGGGLFSHDNAYLADRGQQVRKQDSIWCMTYDPNQQLFYAGTFNSAHFLIIDPATDQVIDRGRPVDGEREIEDIIVASDGTVYGSTYAGTLHTHNPAGGRLFTLDPSTGTFTDIGKPPTCEDWWLSSLVEGPAPDRLIYGASSWSLGAPTGGMLFSYDPAGGTWDDLGNPMEGTGYDEGTRCLVLTDDSYLFGGTWDPVNWDRGHVYCYELGSGITYVEDAPGGYRKYVNHLIELDGNVYGAQDNGDVFSFPSDPAGFDPTMLGPPVANTESVHQPSPAADNTIMFGTRGYAGMNPGHVVNYDPDCGFRDVGIPLFEYQDRVGSLAFADDLNIMIGGTYGKMTMTEPMAARLFRVDPYIVNEEKSALSTGVFPAVEDLGTPIPGQDEIAALCPVPDDEKVVWGGTANEGSDAKLFKYERQTGDFYDMADFGAELGGHEKILALCPAPDGEKMIYGGTANGEGGPDAHLFSVNTETGDVTDLDVPLADAKGIYSLTAGQDGNIYIGTGDIGNPYSGEPGHLVEYDPDVGFTDLGVINSPGRARITALITGSNGLIYGGTGEYPGETGITSFFSYDPSMGSKSVKAYTFESERTIYSMAELFNKIYIGTGPDGKFFCYDIVAGGSPAKVIDLPYGDNSPVYSLAAFGEGFGSVCGCAGEPGMMFRYSVWEFLAIPPEFLDMGPLTYLNDGVRAATVDNLGKFCFGTSGDAKFVRIDTDSRFRWGNVSYSRTPEPPVVGGQEAYVDIMDKTGSAPVTGLENVGSGTPLSPAADGEWGLRLRGRLTTNDTSATPEIEEWSLNWQELPNIDEIEPDKEYPDNDIWIWGSNFGDVADTVTVGGLPAVVSGDGWNDNCINVTLPAGLPAGEAEVVVTVGGESWEANLDIYAEPLVTSINPEVDYVGETVEINGSGFLDDRDDSEVTFNGTEVVDYNDNEWTNEHIEVTVPEGASSGDLVVTVRDVPSTPVYFDVIEDPQITGIDPDEACAGETVTISGLNFLDTRDGSTVMFGDVAASEYVSWSDGSIEVNVPPGAETGDVTVDVNDGHVSNGWEFTVLEDLAVGIESPEEDAVVEGTIQVEASASGGSGISKVELKVDGDLIGSNSSPPYSYSWNTNTVPDGTHTLTVTAFDNSERTAEDEISVEVDNNETPSASKYWYFAEGCTDYGFETWLLIANPAGREVDTVVEFMDEKGNTELRSYVLLPDSRTTINVADVTGPANVSMKVISESDVVCERTMFWDDRIEGHCSIGTTSLSREWYFAEGCTDYGFETYILLGNPGSGTVNVTLDYMLENGQVLTANHQLAAHSRKTVNVVQEIGPSEFSVKATSGEPGIVAERAMYFGGRRCGTGTIGCQAPATTWYLSEGSTDWGFETWLLLQCPGEDEANVTVTYQKSTGEREEKNYTVPGRSRFTADLSEEVGIADVSTTVKSDQPVVCERAMYWDNRSAGHCTIGSPETGTAWYLAEGCSDYGFETWVLLNNPNEEPLEAVLNFLKDDGAVVPAEVTVPPYSRVSVNAADFVPGSSFSTRVEAPIPLMVERAMYWNGRQGGTGSIGAK